MARGRFEWWGLDGTQSAIDFYQGLHRLSAVPMQDWTVHRITGDALHTLAANFAASDLPTGE